MLFASFPARDATVISGCASDNMKPPARAQSCEADFSASRLTTVLCEVPVPPPSPPHTPPKSDKS